jgi:hypothetical protein
MGPSQLLNRYVVCETKALPLRDDATTLRPQTEKQLAPKIEGGAGRRTLLNLKYPWGG